MCGMNTAWMTIATWRNISAFHLLPLFTLWHSRHSSEIKSEKAPGKTFIWGKSWEETDIATLITREIFLGRASWSTLSSIYKAQEGAWQWWLSGERGCLSSWGQGFPEVPWALPGETRGTDALLTPSAAAPEQGFGIASMALEDLIPCK